MMGLRGERWSWDHPLNCDSLFYRAFKMHEMSSSMSRIIDEALMD